MFLKFFLMILLFLFSFTSVNRAPALRCKSGELVNIGDSKYQVLKRCGEPVYRELVGEKERYKIKLRRKSGKGKSTSVSIEVWVYEAEQLASSWDHELIFEGSNLIEIRHLSPH